MAPQHVGYIEDRWPTVRAGVDHRKHPLEVAIQVDRRNCLVADLHEIVARVPAVMMSAGGKDYGPPRLALLSSLFRLGRRVFRISPCPPPVDGNAREEAGRSPVAAGTHRGSKRFGPGRRALGSAAGSLRCAGSGLSRSYPRLSSLDVSAPKKLLAILSLGLQAGGGPFAEGDPCWPFASPESRGVRKFIGLPWDRSPLAQQRL